MSASWCTQDPGMLLSSGKDGRTILWDVSMQQNLPLGQPLGEFSAGFGEYVHDLAWSPSNPGVFAAASLGGGENHSGVVTTHVIPDMPTRGTPSWTSITLTPASVHSATVPASAVRCLAGILAQTAISALLIALGDCHGLRYWVHGGFHFELAIKIDLFACKDGLQMVKTLQVRIQTLAAFTEPRLQQHYSEDGFSGSSSAASALHCTRPLNVPNNISLLEPHHLSCFILCCRLHVHILAWPGLLAGWTVQEPVESVFIMLFTLNADICFCA